MPGNLSKLGLSGRGTTKAVHTWVAALRRQGCPMSRETEKRQSRPHGSRAGASGGGASRPRPRHGGSHWAPSCGVKLRRPEGGGTSWLESQLRPRRKCPLKKGGEVSPPPGAPGRSSVPRALKGRSRRGGKREPGHGQPPAGDPRAAEATAAAPRPAGPRAGMGRRARARPPRPIRALRGRASPLGSQAPRCPEAFPSRVACRGRGRDATPDAGCQRPYAVPAQRASPPSALGTRSLGLGERSRLLPPEVPCPLPASPSTCACASLSEHLSLEVLASSGKGFTEFGGKGSGGKGPV